MLELSQLKQGVVLQCGTYEDRIVEGTIGELVFFKNPKHLTAAFDLIANLIICGWTIKPEEPKNLVVGDYYWAIENDGSISDYVFHNIAEDDKRLKFGNIFFKLEKAQHAVEKVKELLLNL